MIIHPLALSLRDDTIWETAVTPIGSSTYPMMSREISLEPMPLSSLVFSHMPTRHEGFFSTSNLLAGMQ